MDGHLDPALSAALPAMTHAIRHRGPDGDGFFDDGRAGLGHRRLAIIDIARGAQPIANEDGSCWVMFNGEIYNHTSVRKTLEARGHVFRTFSDTEVIVHAYEEYGPSCVESLDGMFALVVYDQRDRTLFIARDRLGKKPLFYATFGGAFHFASEIKALKASPFWNGEIDLSSLEGYLSLGYFLAPDTAYRHVRKLEPGHWLRVRNGHIEIRKYWDVEQFDDDQRPEEDLLEELTARLRQSVQDRLESEVPLGAFLSGGIDSGLVVSFMSESLGASLQTNSVGFGEAAHNELRAAALTAGCFNTRHHEAIIEPQLEQVLDPILEAFDEPFADSSAIPTYYVSKFARQFVTVALTGDGGDETFGGYDFRYVPHALESRARRVVRGAAGRRLARTLGGRWPRSSALPRPLRVGNVLENLGRDAAAAYYADLCFLKPWDARALMGRPSGRDPLDSPVYAAVTEPYRRCPSPSAVQRAQYADLKVYMPNDPLVKVDRMSMAHALEIRCPLLDHKLVEFAFRIPTERKMPKLRSKHLLRELAATRLPAELATLPKRGFTAPIGRWIAGPYADAFRSQTLGTSSPLAGLIDVPRLTEAFDDHRAGRADHAYLLWATWVLARWCRIERVVMPGVVRAGSGGS